MEKRKAMICNDMVTLLNQFPCKPEQTHTHTHTHTGKATKGKVQDIGEVNKVMPLPLPSSDRVRG